MIRAYDEYGNIIDIVEWERKIRAKYIDDFANVLKENYDYLPQILSQESFGLYIDEYAEQLKEQKSTMRKEISNIIKEWKYEANVKGVVLVGVYADFRDTIRICTDKPGLMIGKGGELFDKYKKKLKEFNQNLEHIEFVETDSWYIR